MATPKTVPTGADVDSFLLGGLLDRLGPHTTGRGCLYVKRLDALDAAVLEDLVRTAVAGRS